ncbi:hypothetical protein SRHO_G00011580 [Serrasalmus rhombeus]
MLQLILILCLVERAGGSPMDNVFWQYANWTAKQYTNDSCYVCHLMPSSVDKHSMATAPLDLSATLQAVAHTCLCLMERVYALASAMRPPRPVYQPLISSTNNMYVCSHAPL